MGKFFADVRSGLCGFKNHVCSSDIFTSVKKISFCGKVHHGKVP